MLLLLLHLLISYLFFWMSGYAVFTLFLRSKVPQPISVILPLTGFIMQIPLLSILSLFFPLNINIFLILCILLITITLLTYRPSPNPSPNGAGLFSLHSSPFTLHPSHLTLLFLFILVLFTASQSPTLPDMWGYHAQSIQWIEKFHVVPGLGNLCSKFAFNFGTFLPLALLSLRPITGQPLFTLNALLFLLVILYVFHIIKKIDQFPISVILLLGVFAVFHYFKPVISSTNVECSSSLLILLLFFLYLSKNYNPDENIKVSFQWIIIGLILILPVIKLSNTVFLLLILPFLWKTKLKTWISITLLTVIIFFPWIYRNTILSGYFWYPFPQFDIYLFHWAIHKDIAWHDYHWIRSWARIPFLQSEQVLNLSFPVWIKIWARHAGFYQWFFLVVGSVSSLWVIINKKTLNSIPTDIKALWIIILVNIITWFFMAPDPRFIIASIILFSIIPLIYLTSSLHSDKISAYSKTIVLGISLTFCFCEIFISKPLTFNNIIKPAKFPSQSMKTWYLNNIAFHSPGKGVNCYDYPLPCSPDYQKFGLNLRGKTLEDGFIDRSEYLPAFPFPTDSIKLPPPKPYEKKSD